MRIISAPTTPPPSIAPESPQDGPAADSSQPQADQAEPNPEEDEPSAEQSRSDQIYAAAINLLDAAMKLGKDGGQHALAASEMMATAVKAAEPGIRDWIMLGEQIGQVAFAVRDAHRSHQASPRVEDVQDAVLSPKELRWKRYSELRRKVEAKTATEAEQKELEQIDAEMSAEVLQATRTRFYREVFDRTREHLIANIGTCHAVALQNDPSDEKIQRFHQDVKKAIDTLEALERTLPDAPPYLVICGR